jgi:hypothetical protein
MRQQFGRHRTDTLDYLQSMLAQMRVMADAEGHAMLAYLIEMAYLEATDAMRGAGPLSIREDKGHSPS